MHDTYVKCVHIFVLSTWMIRECWLMLWIQRDITSTKGPVNQSINYSGCEGWPSIKDACEWWWRLRQCVATTICMCMLKMFTHSPFNTTAANCGGIQHILNTQHIMIAPSTQQFTSISFKFKLYSTVTSIMCIIMFMFIGHITLYPLYCSIINQFF